MGKQVEKLKAERRAERSQDPHAWAEELERGRDWRTMMAGLSAFAVIGLGWYVWTLKQDVARLDAEVQALQPDCVPTPGPSGEMPPPGFC
jgi:hypothetical protein